MSTDTPSESITELLSYSQADEEGVIVKVSRQAIHEVVAENARLREELELIRAALTGDDYASLPSDLPTVRMAHTVRADHDKFRNQVRDTCHRAEQAEARALAAEKDAGRYRWLRDNKSYVAVDQHYRELPKAERTGWTIRLVTGNDANFDTAIDSALKASAQEGQ